MTIEIEAMSGEEKLAWHAAKSRWRASLKRPDLIEEDRVDGALLAYQRQIIACRMFEEAMRRGGG